MADYYEILGLPPTASAAQIQRKYRQLAREYHTDVTEYPVAWAEDRMKMINAAYAILRDPAQRAAYDARRVAAPQAPPPAPPAPPSQPAPPVPPAAASTAPVTARWHPEWLDLLGALLGGVVSGVAVPAPVVVVLLWQEPGGWAQRQTLGLVLGAVLAGCLGGGMARGLGRVVDDDRLIYRALGGAALGASVGVVVLDQMAPWSPTPVAIMLGSGLGATLGALVSGGVYLIEGRRDQGWVAWWEGVLEAVWGSLTVSMALVLLLGLLQASLGQMLMAALPIGSLGCGAGVVAGIAAVAVLRPLGALVSWVLERRGHGR